MEEEFSRVSNGLLLVFKTTLPHLTLLTTPMCLHSFSIISPRAPFTLFPVSYCRFYTLILMIDYVTFHHFLLNKRKKKLQ